MAQLLSQAMLHRAAKTALAQGPLLAALVLTAATLAGPALASPAVPVQESVGVTRDGMQRAAPGGSSRVGTWSGNSAEGAATGVIPQGTPWHGDESGAPLLASTGPVAARQTMAAATSASNMPTSQNSELFFQIQTLQQEVQQLRGLVEELSHQVNRLATDQQTQYRDLDGRIVALRGAGGAPAPASTAGAIPQSAAPAGPAQGVASQAAVQPAAAAPAPEAAGEREAYSAAFELMRARKFPEATAAFNRFVRDYPNSGYTANSFYWLGELYLAQNNMEQARQSFTQVLNLYPDSQKVPDALYKLGVVQHRLGDVTRAREFLNRAISQYPGSSAAALAQTYLAELQ